MFSLMIKYKAFSTSGYASSIASWHGGVKASPKRAGSTISDRHVERDDALFALLNQPSAEAQMVAFVLQHFHIYLHTDAQSTLK